MYKNWRLSEPPLKVENGSLNLLVRKPFLPPPLLWKMTNKDYKSLKCQSVGETHESCDLISSFKTQINVISLRTNVHSLK